MKICFTKSQLIDFYNQAVRKQIPARAKTIQEARQLTKQRLDDLAEKIKSKEIVESQFQELSFEVSITEETLEASPLKELNKYVARSGEFEGKLPEVTGGGKFTGFPLLQQKGETGSQFFKRAGDDIVTKFGFDDTEVARETFENYTDQLKQLSKLKTRLTELRAEKAAIRKGEKLTQLAKGDRRKTFRAIKEFFVLSDVELAKIRQGRDLTVMTTNEFDKFVQRASVQAEKIAERRQALNELQSTIQVKELQKTENLQKSLKLPTIQNMTTEQLRSFDNTLSQFKLGDEFLSIRKLETVDNTDLKGIKTIREARERLAKELNVPIEELGNIRVSPLDRFRYDTALAERNPFYGLLVDSTNESLLNAEARYLKSEKTINELINAARRSKPREFVERIVPQDKQIFKYLDSPNKAEIMKEMTEEEIKAARFIENSYIEMRDYLVQMETLKKYRQDYITHIRRGFLEEWKETNILNALKSVFEQYKLDQAIFNIIDDTGNILPLEKFFQFSLRRTGELKPTENVARAYLAYLKAFEKKQALDAIVPKLDIYAHSLTPKIKTLRGLEFDRSLKTFVNEWINTKKGRTAKIVGIEQGGKIDLLLRAGKTLTSMLDLGLNIPVGVAARFGENITNFVQLGTKNYATGLVRARTTQGKSIVEKYKNFVGRTPWEELADADEGVIGKLFKSAFSLFQDATVRANKTFLLGSITEQEFKSGIIESKRLAELTREMGRFRVVHGAKSVFGATSLGGLLTQYKTWAVPPLRTISNDIQKLITRQVPINSREAHELVRSVLATLGVVFAVKAFVGDDEDDTFLGSMLNKAYRDAMTIVGALDPKTITGEPRLISFISDLGNAISDIIKLEEYKTKPGLKGVSELERTLTPRVIKQFIPKETTEPKTKKLKTPPGLPELPTLKKSLPTLPGLPALP